MSLRSVCVMLTVIFGTSCLPMLAGDSNTSAPFDADPALVQWSPHRVQARAGKKSCREVYPMPEAAKHWTECKSGQFSACGGPEDCTCGDADDRLIWYDCKEGSYALCEDDNTCTDSSRLVPPQTGASGEHVRNAGLNRGLVLQVQQK